MADAGYQTYNTILKSLGIVARYVDDVPPAGSGFYLNENSLEEIEENALASRLGSQIVNRTGTMIDALPSTVYSIAKLASLNGLAYRYAGAGGNLYRRPFLTQGVYTQIYKGMSGAPWSFKVYNPANSSYPYAFFADNSVMLKDNGLFPTPQRNGILQPQFPVQAVAQEPDQIDLDSYTLGAMAYTYTGISGGTIITYVNTTLTSAAATGLQTVTVADPTQIGLFQLLTIDTGGVKEVVLVIEVTSTGFQAVFEFPHAAGATVTNNALEVVVPASTTASYSLAFGGKPISTWPTTLDQEDYIGIYIYVSDPAQIQKITLSFDCGDGSFQSDYFYRIIGQGPLQTLLNDSTDSSTGAADAILSESLGLFTGESSAITALNTGLTQWTPILIQLSEFAGAGRADFNDPVFNWSNVNGYQVQIITNDNSSATVATSTLLLFGGSGPDSFAGVSYDYMFTFFNINDGTESNPSMEMTNVNPPFLTNWVTPRRQPVLLTLTYPTLDPQTTHLRVYRRGGTLGDNFRRIDEIPVIGNSTTYLDIWEDDQIEEADTVSLTNDVPVTSTLPNPVNTFLTAAINTTNSIVTITPTSMQSISVSQQINIGNVLADNFEIAIVLSVTATTFNAFIQNTHADNENVAATASYAQPVGIMEIAFDQAWYAGDPQNPSYLYYSAKGAPQSVSSANFVPISTPDDPITAIVATRTNLFVSTVKRWWQIAPGSNQGQAPTVYPTAADRGCVARGGVCVKGETVYYQALDGIRVFTGSGSQYITRMIEFIFQGIGTTPIVEADQTRLSDTVMAFWNNMVFISYYGAGVTRHRVILDTVNNRWRNDDQDAQSIYLEADTNSILYGDSQGLIHQDRLDMAYDEVNVGGTLSEGAISITLQTPYSDQGNPVAQKNYQNLTIDANTNGQPIACSLLFNDGQSIVPIGTVQTTERARVNLPIASGVGIQAYKASLLIQGAAIGRIFLYQAKLEAIGLAETRQAYDTYWLRFGTDGSKFAKDVYIEYNASAPITCTVHYDEDVLVAPFVFTLPLYNGLRNAFRQRLPPVKFRILRLIMDSNGNDFQLWNESRFRVKPVMQGSGYNEFPLIATEG